MFKYVCIPFGLPCKDRNILNTGAVAGANVCLTFQILPISSAVCYPQFREYVLLTKKPPRLEMAVVVLLECWNGLRCLNDF